MRVSRPDKILAGVLALMAGCSLSESGDKVATKSEKPETAQHAEPAPAPRISAKTHLAAGQMLEKQGDLRGAIEQYERAVSANPRLTTGYSRLGVVYQKLGRLPDSEQMFRQGLAIDPRAAALHNNLGYTYLLQRKYPAAESSFRDALGVSPQFKRAHMNLGIALVHLGKIEDAAIEFSSVVPADVARLNVAVVCMQRGDYLNCEKSLRQALEINPESVEAKAQLERVIKLAQGKSPAGMPPAKRLADTRQGGGEE